MKNMMKAICVIFAILCMVKFGWLAWDFVFMGGIDRAINPASRCIWIGSYGVAAIVAILATNVIDWFWEITKEDGR